MKRINVSKVDNHEALNALSPVEIKDYPWYVRGLKQETYLRIGWDESGILIHVVAVDCHSSAEILVPNGPVYKDSCFEFFFTPVGQLSDNYINLEVNCVGTVYLATRNSKGMRLAYEKELAQVEVRTSLSPNVIKSPDPDDSGWTIDIHLPFKLIESLWGDSIEKNRWYGNFYRCGGAIDDQYAAWCTIDAPEPNFHRPEFFGELLFQSPQSY